MYTWLKQGQFFEKKILDLPKQKQSIPLMKTTSNFSHHGLNAGELPCCVVLRRHAVRLAQSSEAMIMRGEEFKACDNEFAPFSIFFNLPSLVL